ncbi:trypsin-like serine protease [Skeletonema marinoi]|uniref:Trypsin-like serine protease n=1 Tax=Skeletonema marinoi TaxID=267567 RepID=A0AAD9DG93_9STRA|nr:trypsin-like serine protease [Skeletonema marinoi]
MRKLRSLDRGGISSTCFAAVYTPSGETCRSDSSITTDVRGGAIVNSIDERTISVIKQFLTASIDGQNHDFLIQGWRWHCMSLIRDADRLERLAAHLSSNKVNDESGLEALYQQQTTYNKIDNQRVDCEKIGKELFDNASATSSSSITTEQRQRYLREVVRLSTRLSDQLHSMRSLQEMLIVPSISQVVSASEQKSFNNKSRVHLVGMHDAVWESGSEIEKQKFEKEIPYVARIMIERWRKSLYAPKGAWALDYGVSDKIGKQAHNSCAHPLKATIERDGLFWPSSPPNDERIDRSTNSEEDHDDLFDEEEYQTLDAVVKIYATHSDPDFLIPWQKRHQTTSTSSGFVIDVPGLGLRNDDQFQPFAMPIGSLPMLQDDVEVIGYPAGGDSLCVTKGVVSRIEMQEYAQAGARLLAMQIDAAINPGNSGGPVVNDELEVVGVAFQGIDEESIENVGYVVPSSVVRHFLEDVRRNNGIYTGFCQLGIEVSFLENKAYRKFLKMANLDGENKRISGVCVRRVQPSAGAYGILKSMDVVMAVDGIPVGDVATATIFRDGKEMEVSIPVSPIKDLVPSHYNNKPPPYLICSGFVFTALSVPYLDAKGAWDDFYTEDVSYLLGLVHTPLKQKGDEVVVLAQVLAHEANLGYEHLIDLHLLKFNGVEVKSLGHLNDLISENEEQFMTLEFAPEEGGRLIVMERALCEQATEDVCKEHSIGSHYVLRTDTV